MSDMTAIALVAVTLVYCGGLIRFRRLLPQLMVLRWTPGAPEGPALSPRGKIVTVLVTYGIACLMMALALAVVMGPFDQSTLVMGALAAAGAAVWAWDSFWPEKTE